MSSKNTHFGRSFEGHWIEDACVCEQEPCGLISDDRRNPDCDQHTMMKTIRQSHLSEECPGLTNSWADAVARNHRKAVV